MRDATLQLYSLYTKNRVFGVKLFLLRHQSLKRRFNYCTLEISNVVAVKYRYSDPVWTELELHVRTLLQLSLLQVIS